MIDIDEAYRLLADTFEQIRRPPQSESLAVVDAAGRTLAQPLHCRLDSPPFNQSAMDGVAFAHQTDRHDFKLIGSVAAGDAPDQLQPNANECVRIMTGAPLPSSCDTVEMVEKITVEEGRVTLNQPPDRGTHVRRAGENNRSGDTLYPSGTRITPGVLSGLLSQGVRFVNVVRPVRVGIAATGDEIIDHRRPLQPGQIYNSNELAVGNLLRTPGVEIIQLGNFSDNLETTRACLAHNSDLDVIVLSGGVSMGNYDLVPDAAAGAGYDCVFHKVRMKPGKPLWFGRHDNGSLLFGLPGNPVSAMVGAMLYIQPMLTAMTNGSFQKPAWITVEAGEPASNRGRLPLMTGVRFKPVADRLTAVPLKTNGSGDIIGFSTFDSIARLEPGSCINSGDNLQVLLPFRSTLS